MYELMHVGIAVGIIMYIGKLGSLELLLLKFPKTRKWLHSSPVILFFIDLGFNIIALEVIQIAGGLTAMIAGITFQLVSIMFCYTMYIKHRYLSPVIADMRRVIIK